MISDADLATLQAKVAKLTTDAAANTAATAAAMSAATAADAANAASTTAKLAAATAAALVDSDVADLQAFIDGLTPTVPVTPPVAARATTASTAR